jgi:hypothetical protein
MDTKYSVFNKKNNNNSDTRRRVKSYTDAVCFEENPKEHFLTKVTTRKRYNSEIKGSRKNFYCAGILPFYVKNSTVYFLLGKDHEGKWSDFGGRSEGKDNGRWDVTAAREFYEETIGSVMDIPSVLSRISMKKHHLKIKSKTLNGSNYFMYVLRIPYKDYYRINFTSTLSFIKYTK